MFFYMLQKLILEYESLKIQLKSLKINDFLFFKNFGLFFNIQGWEI